jgi:malonyl CoA-acyl carrier protein transacylase/acyl carrier protein/SAM-dependent methyltransferase
VGDPIEFESIRRVFGRKERESKSYVASVKGNIGHLEGASGVAALIKTLLMMQHKTIPVQANFQSLNPKIPSLDADNMAIPVTTQPWIANEFITCINNYGAAGSNAAIIVRGPPRTVDSEDNNDLPLPKYPILISAHSATSLSTYCDALRKWLATQSQPLRLSDVAFNLARTQNRALPHAITTTVTDIPGLEHVLASGANKSSPFNVQLPSAKPVVLVFGGQTSTKIGLDKGLYDASTLLRLHLDACDRALHANGLPGLYPAIFQTEPISDIIQLHCMLYSLQYSSAKAWMDSGVHVDAVIGHSFGELTALAVCGSLSFTDGLKLVSGRAALMQHSWGAERGSMLAVESDASALQRLFEQVAEQKADIQLEIACYNGPTSHVAVGTEASIVALQEAVSARGIQQKKLDVSHGFHSVFTEPILPALAKLAEELHFHHLSIPIETCSKDMSPGLPKAEHIVEHTRTPVYFGEAIARIAHRLGPCTWIEAGSASSVTNMVRRALGGDASTHTFQGLLLNTAGSNLADATANLWSAGHNVNFWPFHRSQSKTYRSIISLPPYQFERNRHWLDWSEPAPIVSATQPAVSSPEPVPRQLLSFTGYNGEDRDAEAHFQVDPLSDEYKYYVHGHAVLANPLCPAPLYVELVARAAITLMGDGKPIDNYIPQVEDLEIKAPLGKAIAQNITLVLKKQGVGYIHPTWLFEMSSIKIPNGDYSGGSTQLHATGTISLKPQEDRRLANDFACYEQLVGYDRYERLRNDDATEAMQGPVIYKIFAKVVTYVGHYKGVNKIYALKNEVAGHVTLQSESPEKSITEPLAVDNFIQVSGLHVNSFQDCGDNEVNVCTHVDQILPGPKYRESIARQNRSWVVYSSSSPTPETREVLNNIFVFDKATRELVFVVLGARFTRVLISSLSRVLGRANKGESTNSTAAEGQIQPTVQTSSIQPRPKFVEAPSQLLEMHQPTIIKPARDIMGEIKTLLNRVAEIPMDQFKDNASLIDIGVDSLMITEVMNELATHFKLDIPTDEFANLPDLKALEIYLISRGCGGALQISSTSITRARSSSESSVVSSVDSQSMTITATTTPARTPAGSVIKVPPPTSSIAAASADGVISRLAKIVETHLETESNLTRQTNLGNEGLDSLLWIEVANDIKEAFPTVDVTDFINPDPTLGDLCDFIESRFVTARIAPAVEEGYFASSTTQLSSSSSIPITTPNAVLIPTLSSEPTTLKEAQKAFEETRWDYDVYTKETGFSKFWLNVYPSQSKLVLAYTVEAIAKLGCILSSLQEGDQVPSVQCLPKHSMELAQLYHILEDGLLIAREGGSNTWVRTKAPVDPTPSATLLAKILQGFPLHASEHRLLHTTGSKLAECLSGTADPLQLLFRKKEDRELLEEVYTYGPMYEAITKLLASFLGKAYANIPAGETVNILELGGGTGGTTKFVVGHLTRNRVPFTYTFTDLSGSLVTAARHKFSSTYSNMDFMTLDIEKAPPQKFHGQFHTIISTNCIHATSNLAVSCTNMRAMLRPDGFISLVEFTRNMYWFDIVFGLLEGWWLFKDGRKHVLGSETFWEQSMRTAGFKHISWTDGASEEARTLRIITSFNAEAQSQSFIPRQISSIKHNIQTVAYKREGNLDLLADIYLPKDSSPGKRPIGLSSLFLL